MHEKLENLINQVLGKLKEAKEKFIELKEKLFQ
jgi:hypothetical protein